MRFNNFYFQEKGQFVLDLDDCIFDKDMQLEGFYITDKNAPSLIKEGVLEKSYITEADEDEPDVAEKDKKNVVQINDPETGEITNFEVALGNVKIGGDTVLLNMSTAGSCMSAIIGTCSLAADGKCYARRFEVQWKGSEEKNKRHEKQWACLSPLAIAKGLDNICKKMTKIKYIRVNEAGEFRNLPTDPNLLAKVSDEKKAELSTVDDVAKLRSVAKYLKELGNPLMLYTYTHRSDLSIGDLGDNVCINGSGWMIDNAFIPLELNDFIEVVEKTNRKELTEFNGEPVTKGVHCLGDCRKCNFCKTKTKKHIFLPIHGSGTAYDNRIEKIVHSVIGNPEFTGILSQSVPDEQKGRLSFDLLSPEDKKTLGILVPILSDRVDLFTKIIKSKGNIELLVKAIEQYVKASNMKVSNDGSVDVNVSDEDSTEGLAKSVDALTGKFEAAIEGALAAGQAPALKKWTSLSQNLQKAIAAAKAGKEIKPSGALAKQFKGVSSK
jgi:hypothetical protein